MERWAAKVLSLFVIFIITLTATLLPLKLKSLFEKWGKKGQRIVSYMMCFGGGVFFSIYMLHMAPDAQEIVKTTILDPYGITYPLGELLISMGFFLMVFSEKIVQKLNKPTTKTTKKVLSVQGQQQIGQKLSIPPSEQAIKSFSLEDILKYDINDPQRKETALIEWDAEESEALNGKTPTIIIESVESVYHHGHSHEVHANLTGTRSLILLLALSLHHVFEGISVGLKHSVTAVMNLTVAIVCHEIVIAFSLGLQLVKAYKSTKKILIAAIMCTLMVPIGIAIGMALMETGHENSNGVNIANGILQSLATGVFIYVTFFEILLEEISQEDTSIKKLLCMLFGFILMAMLGLVPEEIDLNEYQKNCTLVCY